MRHGVEGLRRDRRRDGRRRGGERMVPLRLILAARTAGSSSGFRGFFVDFGMGELGFFSAPLLSRPHSRRSISRSII